MSLFVLEKVVDEVIQSYANVDAMKLSVVKAAQIKSKPKSMAPMMLDNKTLRDDHELILQLKRLCPGNHIPHMDF